MTRKVKQPETSRIAHENKSEESKQRDYLEIKRALMAIGSGTYEDVSLYLGWEDINKSARRFKEMRDRKEIENTGLKKNTSRNRPAFIHKICDGKAKSGKELVEDMVNVKSKCKQPELF